MGCSNLPIPEAAREAGLSELVFCEDFENEKAIDFSGKGLPGHSFYVQKNRSKLMLTPEQAEMRSSVLHLRPTSTDYAATLYTYHEAAQQGFLVHFGYIEARIRANCPIGRHQYWPKFWGVPVACSGDDNHDCKAELVIVEFIDPLDKGRSRGRGKDMIYTGTLHEHRWELDKNGEWQHRLCTNSVNATGYNDEFCYVDTDWHVYGVLWEPGHVAWYMDGELMHSVRFVGGALPEYFYRDNPRPLPRIEETFPDHHFQVWEGAHTITDRETMALVLTCHPYWPMDVDWVRVWQ